MIRQVDAPAALHAGIALDAPDIADRFAALQRPFGQRQGPSRGCRPDNCAQRLADHFLRGHGCALGGQGIGKADIAVGVQDHDGRRLAVGHHLEQMTLPRQFRGSCGIELSRPGRATGSAVAPDHQDDRRRQAENEQQHKQQTIGTRLDIGECGGAVDLGDQQPVGAGHRPPGRKNGGSGVVFALQERARFLQGLRRCEACCAAVEPAAERRRSVGQRRKVLDRRALRSDQQDLETLYAQAGLAKLIVEAGRSGPPTDDQPDHGVVRPGLQCRNGGCKGQENARLRMRLQVQDRAARAVRHDLDRWQGEIGRCNNGLHLGGQKSQTDLIGQVDVGPQIFRQTMRFEAGALGRQGQQVPEILDLPGGVGDVGDIPRRRQPAR